METKSLEQCVWKISYSREQAKNKGKVNMYNCNACNGYENSCDSYYPIKNLTKKEQKEIYFPRINID